MKKKKSLKVQYSPTITEKQFESQVKQLAKMFGWRYYHTWRSIHSPAGFPDCVMVHREKKRLIFAELKSEEGEPTSEQVAWLDDLRECVKVITIVPITKENPLSYLDANKSGTLILPEVYLWRPSNLETVIVEVLR